PGLHPWPDARRGRLRARRRGSAVATGPAAVLRRRRRRPAAGGVRRRPGTLTRDLGGRRPRVSREVPARVRPAPTGRGHRGTYAHAAAPLRPEHPGVRASGITARGIRADRTPVVVVLGDTS